MKQLVAGVLLVLAACVAKSFMRLETTWRGEVHPGVYSTLEFGQDGGLRWTFDLPDGAEVYELEYELALHPDRKRAGGVTLPMYLDIRGFDKGPFTGKTLYGIARWDEETLVYEAVPGDPKSGGEGVRPKDFSKEARTFTRVR